MYIDELQTLLGYDYQFNFNRFTHRLPMIPSYYGIQQSVDC